MDDNERHRRRERAKRVTWALITGDRVAIDEAFAAISADREAGLIDDIAKTAKANITNDNA